MAAKAKNARVRKSSEQDREEAALLLVFLLGTDPEDSRSAITLQLVVFTIQDLSETMLKLFQVLKACHVLY